MANGYPTPQDAEDAFYDAFEALDLEALMSVWADSDEIACVNPMGPLLRGRVAVREGWQQVISYLKQAEIEIHHRDWIDNGDLAVHIVEEKLTVPGMPPGMPPTIATNVYRKHSGGWHLVLHHASMPPPPPGIQSAGPPSNFQP